MVRTMSFGMAVLSMELGQAVAREGWNGKGQFLYLVPATSYPAQTGVAKEFFGQDALVPYGAYIALKNAQGIVVPWTPSQSDQLARDYVIVDLTTDQLSLPLQEQRV